MDYQVQQAQRWVNSTYAGAPGYGACPEDGITGWSTIYSLTRGLQRELGISALSDNFGDTTMSRMVAFGPVSSATANRNVKTIVEAAMYCKGYTGGTIDGRFGASTQAGLVSWKNDMGFAASGVANSVSAKEMKTLLTMDAYVLLPGGNARVRDVQRWLNLTYLARADFTIVPCDGYFSRSVQRGLLLGVQYSLGMADGVANGNFGPGTRDGLRAKATLMVGAADSGATRFVKLFKAALIFNAQPGVDWPSATFTATTSTLTRSFQSFCFLPTTGGADYQTWCSLLVSTGDPNRPGKASDCVTPLNAARAAAIAAAGYETVGRSLTGGTQKVLTASEVQVILSAGLTLVPIYQEFNNALSYFDSAQGASQAQAAHKAGLDLGLPTGSIIYFAVDFDATGDEIRSNVLPYFNGVSQAFTGLGNKYSVGIYGSRNVCSTVSEAGYATSSFVGGMSSGFSGNLGFPLPPNWAFDQVQTLTLAPGAAGQVEIDKDVKSNRDHGISSLTRAIDQNGAFFTWVVWIEARAGEWLRMHPGSTTQQLTAAYLRTYIDDRYNNNAYNSFVGGVNFFDTVSGNVDEGFNAYCKAAQGRPDPGILRDPKTGYLCDLQHFGASLGAVLHNDPVPSQIGVSLVDFGGWAGDLITITGDCYNSGTADADAYAYGYDLIGNNRGQKSFAAGDMVADVEAMVVGLAVQKGAAESVSAALSSRYASAAASKAKYNEFITARFGGLASLRTASQAVFGQNSDAKYDTFRGGLWLQKTSVPILISTAKHGDLFAGMCSAFADVVLQKFAA